jgi:hypothetical protein
MIYEARGVDLVRDLEFALVEDLFKYAPRDGLVPAEKTPLETKTSAWGLLQSTPAQ